MKKIISVGMVLILILSSQLMQVSANTESYDMAQQLYDFWFENYSSIRPFGEDRKPDSAFISDIDNDTKPELLVYFSYLGPGGPAIAIYKNNDGNIYHENSITTSSGTGIHHNLSLIMENNGDIKISDHYMCYPFGDLGAQSISLMHYNAGNCVIEEYAYVSYLDEISYSQDISGENRTYCTIYEADNFFDTVYKRINHNVVFSSEWDINQGNVCFEIWKKQKELRKQITVLIDDKKIIFDQPPIIVDGRTLVPLRAIFEELGATVSWDGSTQTVTSAKGQTTISMSVGKTEMYKNGNLITLDVSPKLINGRTLVPARAIAEAFGCKVDWNEETRTVIINTIDTEKVISTAENLYQANEDMGGVTELATYAKVDALLYNALNEIDKTLAVNEFTLDMVSACTAATIAAAKVSAGSYTSIDNIGDGLSKLLSSKEIADAADGVLDDAIKQRVFNEISSSVPDANAFILNLGTSAYDRNSKMIQEFIVLHSKFKSGNYTYDDAVAYIVMHDTLVINRKTMSMAVEVLSDELPQNFLESLLMSAEASAKAVLSGMFGDAFSGRGISVSAELFTDIVTAYTDYACGQGVDLFKYIKQMNHPAITEWSNEFEAYDNNLKIKLCIN